MSARKLNVESLETREVLSGNVTAAVVSGDLVITGDSLSNSIQVRQVSTNTFTVRGIGTTVNGSFLTRSFSGVIDDIRISMNAGHDVVDIKGPNTDKMVMIPDDLDITGGSGNDRIDLQCVHAKDDVLIETGSGRNVVKGVFLAAYDDIAITKSFQNADDFDTIALKFCNAGSHGQGRLTIDLNNGADRVYLYNIMTDGITVKTDGGNDYVSLVYINRDASLTNRIDTGSGTDTVNTYSNTTQLNPSKNNDIPRVSVETVTRFNRLNPEV